MDLMCNKPNLEHFKKCEISGKKIIVLDVETTGFSPDDDELLQVSIIDGEKNILFDHYIKPMRVERWDKAMEVNGITPDMVKGEKHITSYKEELQKIIDDADIIITYNGEFDFGFLEESGIKIDRTNHYDVMKIFAEYNGEWDDYRCSWRWKKLVYVAEVFGFDWSVKAHNSLGDVIATLYCFERLLDVVRGEGIEG